MYTNTIPASEVKRRGILALEEHLKQGPVHVIKNNRPACVVLSEEDYAMLIKKAPANSLWDLLDNRPKQGRSKKAIDAQIKKERGSWKK